MPNLIQLHWQYKNGTTEMCAQREINNYTEMHAFVDDTKISHPLPEDVVYLAVPEKSKHFVWAKAGGN